MFYQTQYTDPTTGDTLMQARWYTPTSATFRSRDTYAGDLNTPVTLNRYTYGANNPIRYWDPSGRNNCRTSSDICDGKVVDSQGKLVATGTKAGSFNTDIVRGGNNNPSDHCIGKSDCRAMVDVSGRTDEMSQTPAGYYPNPQERASLVLPSLGNDVLELQARLGMVLDHSAIHPGNFVVGGELAGFSRVGIEEAFTYLLTDGSGVSPEIAASVARDLAANHCFQNARQCEEEEFWDEMIRTGGALLEVFAFGAAIAGAPRAEYAPSHLDRPSPSPLVGSNQGPGWSLPSSGGARINGRWYTEHALERMAPNSPQVMADLTARSLARAAAAGLKPGTPEFKAWWATKGPDPRSIPTMVVEAEIYFRGSTNVTVILAEGRVVTVIPNG